ncbi:DUF4185 domain-containing protein [Gordonia sp. TBRC 11910]|uniref:DUF4185 domain-containing protein n=1 Tax=Gordonia asplenii TaxID=2725283 RepID=A0A848L3Y3_9ACTN|nr:DUF4185 domain-containing protein [Gordonia asplenii]NMO03765.1 DUF4185 domain-containing protein [Gordonia asplenii]
MRLRAGLLGVSAVAAAVIGSTITPMGAARALPANYLPSSGCINDVPAKPKPRPIGPQDLLPKLPDRIGIPLPYPRIVPVPEPAPEEKITRIKSEAAPKNICHDPCPDLTDPPKPQQSNAGGNGSLSIAFPKVGFDLKPITIPIVVPNPNPPATPPPPTAVRPGVDAAPLTAKPATPRIGAVRWVSTVTGQGSTSRTDKRWQVKGTDLGIMWQSKPGQVAIAFGDTFGKGFTPPGANGGDWRSNILGFSSTKAKDLSKGLAIDTMVQDSRCHAVQVLSSRHVNYYEMTTIPTSGFAIGKRQYMTYMSVRTWGPIPGVWLTNYGGLAYSDDAGSTWTRDPYARWDNIFGVSQFQVSSMVPQGDYVYMFGTPNSRLGSIGLARVPANQVLNKTAYQYWHDGRWIPARDGNVASVLFAGPTGELSVHYDDKAKRWELSYLDSLRGAIVLRTSTSPQGVWSDAAPMVDSGRYPQLYGGFIHPWSTGSDLYFTMSTWTDYNVSLMRARVDY